MAMLKSQTLGRRFESSLTGALCFMTVAAALYWHGPFGWSMILENSANLHVERLISDSGFNAAAFDPDSPRLLRQGRQAQWARDVYDSLREPRVGALSMAGFLALGELRTRDAINSWERARAILPVRPTVAFNLGRLYEGLGRRAEALAIYRLDPNIAGAFLTQGHTALNANDWNRAALAYEWAYDIDPHSDQTQYFMAETENYFRKNHETALILYEQATRSGYPAVFVWSRIAHAYALAAQYTEALATLDRHLQDNALANAIRGDAFRASGRSGDAILAYQKSLAQEPNNPWVWLNLGYSYLHTGDGKRAHEAWRQALVYAPGFAPAQDALSR